MANSTSQPKPEEDKPTGEPPKQEGKEKESTKDTVAVSKEEFEKLKSELEGHKGTIKSYQEKLEKLDKIEAGLKNLVSDEHGDDEDPVEALRQEITELKQESAEGKAIKRKEDTLAQLDISAGKKAYLRKVISGKEENLEEAVKKASEEYDRFSELDKKPGSDNRPNSAKPIGSAYGPNANVADILKAGDPLRK